MKKIFVVLFAVLIASVTLEAGANLKSLPYKPGTMIEKLVTTYAGATTDTIIVTKDPAAQAFSFGYYTADSSNITNVIVQRRVAGYSFDVQVGDTLVTAADSSATAKLRLKTFTIAPQADQYYILVKYTSNVLGAVIKNGVTTPTVIYQVTKQFSK